MNLRKKEFKKLLLLPKGELKQIDLNTTTAPVPSWMTRAFMNNRYCIMINDNATTTAGKAIRVMIQRLDDTPIPRHWSEIQEIKNTLFGKEAIGIEYYPKESELINDHNIYWLWIFNESQIPKPIAP